MKLFWLTDLPSVLLLVILPLTVLAQRLGWFFRPSFRWAFGFLTAVLIFLSLPLENGLDLAGIKRLNLLFCVITTLLIFLKYGSVGWFKNARLWLILLGTVASLSTLNYLNYLSFHGARTFVQLHDVAHYYLGAKYFPELRYDKLYTAMLRAEVELRQSPLTYPEVRDLATNRLVAPRDLLLSSEAVKARFTPKRWALFLADVEYFLTRIEPVSYAGILIDHGFNATPFWTLIGGALANRLTVATDTGILWLALIDPLLLLLLFIALWRTFGPESAWLCLIFYTVAFGATFGWTGGAFLRQGWLFSTGMAFCFLHRRKMAWAGACLAIATLLRIFPLAFTVGILVLGCWDIRRHSMIEKGRWRFMIALLVGGILGLAATSLQTDGVKSWGYFKANTELHMKNISPNLVGATQLLAYRPEGAHKVSAEVFQELKERRQKIRRVQLMTLLPFVFLFMIWFLGRQTMTDEDANEVEPSPWDLRAAAMGVLLLFSGLDLAAYYYVFLMLLLPVLAERKRDLALIFAAETALYSLTLFTNGSALPYIHRSWLVFCLLLIVYAVPTAKPSQEKTLKL